MAKKKKFVADKVRNRKVDTQKKINPFEVKINRQKHDILGRKLTKHDHGLPGVSRSKANKRRKETLLQEYEQRFKANQLVDRRLGENDPNLSVEDKMLRRYAAERERSGVAGGGKFNLNEGEELTHYGQSLAEMDKFEDPDISDDEEDSGKIEGDMVAQEHFGGFLTRKDTTSENTDDKKSWKERMEEMITKSKKAKFERQSEKEKSLEMTEKLDEQWKDVAHLLGDLMGKGSKGDSKPAVDDYDIAVRELKYEMKGKPSDRLKTEEEIAKEEKERLENLEADRVRRMKGILVDKERSQSQHQSADSLEDGFVLDTDKSDRIAVRFHDGKLVPEDSGKDSDEEDEDEDGVEDNEEEDASESDACDNEEDVKSEDILEDKEDNDEDNEVSDDEDEDEESDNSEDSYADIMSDSDGEEQVKHEQIAPKTKVKSILKKKPETEEIMKKKQEIKKAAKKELPYTFEAPSSYDALLELMAGRSESDQLTIIERVRKCHHASLAEGNKAKMETLLRLLIQYYGSLAVQEVPCLSLIDKLTRHIYELTQTFPSVSADTLQRILLNQQNDFNQLRERKKPVLLTLDILLYLKLVCVLFPTSDFSHPVTTPAMIFMGQLISQSPVNTERDVASGLFLCNLFLEYLSQSKRFVPEVISFLHGVLFLAADKEPNKIERLSGPFKPVGKTVNLLHVKDKKSKSVTVEAMKMSQVFGAAVERNSLSSAQFKLTLIQCCVNLLIEFSRLYEDLPAHRHVFSPVLYMCTKLPQSRYPQSIQEGVSRLVAHIKERSERSFSCLVFNKAKPKPLKMFEPQIEESWDGRKKKGGGNKEYNEKQKLLHKVKKEMKGAIREIRKDSQFLARHQLQETLHKDSERKRKVKALYGNLANQEGDYNEMKRKKKK